jgi:hypothetical protein
VQGAGTVAEEAAIVPVQQRTIDFYGDELVAVRDEQGTIWVPVRPLCDSLGVAWTGQRQRIMRDPVLAEAVQFVRVTRTNAGNPNTLALPLKYIRGWLFGINATRVKPEIRDKLIQYQKEIYEVIDRAFSRSLDTPDLDDEIIQTLKENALQQAKIWEAIQAERRRLRATEQFVEELDGIVGDHEKLLRAHDRALAELRALQQEQSQVLARLTDSIRLLPGPRESLNPQQKAAIKALVDDIVAAAEASGKRIGQGRNDYPAVWDAFKRRFDLAKYDELTIAQYDEAITWLKSWLDRLQPKGQ